MDGRFTCSDGPPLEDPPPPCLPIAAFDPGAAALNMPVFLLFLASPLSYWPVTMFEKAPRHEPIVRRMRSDVSRLAFT